MSRRGMRCKQHVLDLGRVWGRHRFSFDWTCHLQGKYSKYMKETNFSEWPESVSYFKTLNIK